MKIAIMTDSAAYIPQTLRESLHIHQIPLNVIFGEEVFHDEVDIQVNEFYEKVRTSSVFPKTSQPATGEFVAMYEKLATDFDAVISIHISSGISGTYAGALAAKEMVEGIDVRVFDSKIACSAQAYFVLEAVKLVEEGKNVDEILARLEEIRKSLGVYFVVEDLKHLQRGGRVSNAAAVFGTLLQMKPVLTFTEGNIIAFEKIRTFKKARNRIIELLGEAAASGKQLKASVIHADALETAEGIKRTIEETYGNVEVELGYIGPVVGAHIGEGSVGLTWYEK